MCNNMKPNEVVWADQKGVWNPGVILHPRDRRWPELKGVGGISWFRKSEHFVLLLAQGSIVKMKEDSLRDFCIHFNECFSGMNNSDQTLSVVEVLVQLAATRAELPNPGKNWETWALSHLHEFKELVVSETFLEVAAESEPREMTFKKNGVPGRCGEELEESELVWAKAGLQDRFWPAIVVPAHLWPKGKLRVFILTQGSHNFDINFADVFSFGPYFAKKFQDSCFSAEEPHYRTSVMVAVRLLSGGEANEGNWLTWARNNMANCPKFIVEKTDYDGLMKKPSQARPMPRKAVSSSREQEAESC